jgi:sugar phosphate isomerase/epimerase
MKICLDIGHRNLDGTKEEADHLAWIKRYGKQCDVIDCQQTDLNASRHWPFTPEYNENGIIKAEKVVEAIHESGAEEVLLALEIKASAFHPQEYNFLEQLEKSVEYWRNWVKE